MEGINWRAEEYIELGEVVIYLFKVRLSLVFLKKLL